MKVVLRVLPITADPTTEAGAPPSASCGLCFHGKVDLDLSRKWVGEDTGVPLLWGLQSEHLGTVMVSNGVDSEIPEG